MANDWIQTPTTSRYKPRAVRIVDTNQARRYSWID